jgi:hypothetical protein
MTSSSAKAATTEFDIATGAKDGLSRARANVPVGAGLDRARQWPERATSLGRVHSRD